MTYQEDLIQDYFNDETLRLKILHEAEEMLCFQPEEDLPHDLLDKFDDLC